MRTDDGLAPTIFPMLFESVAIVGVGLIGGSIGLAAKARGLARQVVGIGRNPATLTRAIHAGAIDSSTTDLAGVSTCDLVVFCSPVDCIAEQALAAAAYARPGTTFTDAGSTKANIVRDLDAALPKHVHFVGGHPLAGSEKQGVEYSRADLFSGRTCVLTPTPKTSIAALERVHLFWSAIGSDVRRMSPEEHDLALATTSHMPHFVAALLAAQLPEAWQPLAATGFRDATRIAAGDPGLWSAIARENTLALVHTMDRFAEQLKELRDAVLAQSTDDLVRILTDAKKVRDALGS